ncbi:hypothetical protein [Mucilaginibacter sp.]
MIKWFAYIVLLLIMTPGLSSAKKRAASCATFYNGIPLLVPGNPLIDTTSSKNTKHQQDADDKKKIKEIAKARRQPKPEKIVIDDAPAIKKQKPKRQRRPEGLEQPPEIPRRNDN